MAAILHKHLVLVIEEKSVVRFEWSWCIVLKAAWIIWYGYVALWLAISLHWCRKPFDSRNYSSSHLGFSNGQ